MVATIGYDIATANSGGQFIMPWTTGALHVIVSFRASRTSPLSCDQQALVGLDPGGGGANPPFQNNYVHDIV
jgi:hypothetical protein